MDAMLTALRSAHSAAENPDPDDELVATWDAWRREWLAFKAAGPDSDDSAVRALDRKLIEAKPHGLRGIAAKTGYALWYMVSREEKEGLCGLTAPEIDMNYDLLCAHNLAAELERMTGVIVNPLWDRSGWGGLERPADAGT